MFQRYQFPAYMGLSGPERLGTDDIKYFYGLNVKVTYTVERYDIAFGNTYSPLINLLYLPQIYNPIDIVTFNILGIVFIPYLTNKICTLISNDSHVGSIAEKLILFCPFMMSVGLIIMRDVLCTTLILSSFLCFIKKRYILFACLAVLLAYLKFGFIVFLGVVLVVYMFTQEKITSRNNTLFIIKYTLAIVTFASLMFIYIIPNLASLTGGRLSSESLFRESFIEYLQAANEESILVKLYELPIIFKIPALIISFLVLPPLTPNFIRENHFLIVPFFQNCLAPIYWCFLYVYLFAFFLSFGRLSTRAKEIFYTIIFVALALGMISLQSRHKVVLMPFIYMAIAYAIKNKLRGQQTMSIIFLFIFVLAQFVYLYTHL